MASTENLSPHIMTRVMREIRDLVKAPVDGIQYEENEDNSMSEIHAVLTGPGNVNLLFFFFWAI
jgi:hypothetical protein